MLSNSKLSSFLIMFILGKSISIKFSKVGFLWFQSSLISLKPGLEQVIVVFWNWVLIFFMVSIIWGLIWPEMKFILSTLNWSQNPEIILLNEFKYCFSGGWIIKSSSWLLMKKVLKEVPFSRLNSSSNLSLFWSKNLTQEKFSVISNSDKFYFLEVSLYWYLTF